MLNKIKMLLGITDNSKDELLMALIESTTEEAINYTHNDNIADMNFCICNMVVYNYNRLGTEGLSSETFSNNSYDYTNDYPESILRQLRSHRKLMVF